MLRQYADMLANPCTATLKPGFNGTDEGILSRLKTTFQSASGATSGFVLWCPTYVGGDEHFNCIVNITTDPADPTVNTIAAPLGTGGASGLVLDAGATNFVQSSTVSDFRLLSGCMRVTYTGALQASSGLLASVENLPVDTFLLGQASLDDCASVDNLFALSAKVQRFGVETHEIRYRPSGAALETFKQDVSGVYTIGTPASTRTTMTNESRRFAPVFFGFAWKGVASNTLSFDFIQNIEWRPETGAGFPSVVPRQVNPDSYKRTVASWLDTHYPGWATAAQHHAKNAIFSLATSMFTGVSQNPLITHVLS
jgi:hypothetical protein